MAEAAPKQLNRLPLLEFALVGDLNGIKMMLEIFYWDINMKGDPEPYFGK